MFMSNPLRPPHPPISMLTSLPGWVAKGKNYCQTIRTPSQDINIEIEGRGGISKDGSTRAHKVKLRWYAKLLAKFFPSTVVMGIRASKPATSQHEDVGARVGKQRRLRRSWQGECVVVCSGPPSG